MDFIYFFRVLLKRKWLIIGAALLAATVAFLLTMNQPKEYRSSAQISTAFTVSEQVRVADNFSFYEAETKFNNAIVTFTSPSAISLLSYNLILHDLDSSQKPFRQLTEEQKQSDLYRQINQTEAKKTFREKLMSMTPLTSFKPEERKLLNFLSLYGYDNKSITGNLNVYRLERTDYIQIDYVSENPELSAFVVNDVFQQFLRYNKDQKGINSKESIDTLRSLVEKKKEELAVKNALLRNTGYVDEGTSGSSALEVAGNLQERLEEAKAKLNDQEYDLKSVNQKIAAIGGRTVERSNSGNNNEEIIAARKAKNEAYRDYLDNPSDDGLKRKWEQLTTEYNRLVRTAGGDGGGTVNRSSNNDNLERLRNEKTDLENDILASRSTIGSLSSQINRLKGEAISNSSRGESIETLKKDRDLANQEYLDAQRKFSNATDVTSSGVNNFRQVVQGQPAIEPEPSKRKLVVGMAGAAALVTTMLIIIFLTYLDSSIKTPYIFQKIVGHKLISMVNFMDLKNKNIADIVAKKEEADNWHERNKLNTFRESIRKLRFEIEHTGKKVFLFTSTKKGQGKTTLIQALSYSLSLSKKKILIIDTNFCNPDLTTQLDAEPVLEKMVPYKADGKALVEQVKVYSKDVSDGFIFVIGAEGGDYTPSEVLPRENLLHHLQSLTSEFDYIFLEGPPLNDFSDSRELAQYVDGVIAVFSAQHIIKQIDKQSISFFKELNGKFCGSILNMVDLKNVNVT